MVVTLAPLLDAEGRQALEGAILQGPPREMFKEHVEPERLQRTFDRQIWLRLAKCTAAGAELGADAAIGGPIPSVSPMASCRRRAR